MIDPPQVVQTAEQQTALIHLVTPRTEIQQVMGPGLREVFAALAAQGLTPTGPWFSHHLRRPSETLDFEISVPVAAPVKPVGRVKPGVLRATRAARTTYHGGYEGLGAAWGEFLKWVDASGHPQADDLWEVYLSGPEASADPTTFRTRLNRPLVGERVPTSKLDGEKARRAAAHPDRPGEKCTAPPGTFVPKVDRRRCEGKADCVAVCPYDVFEVKAIDEGEYRALPAFSRFKLWVHGKKTAYTPHADNCRACGLCVVACPERAIELVPGPG